MRRLLQHAIERLFLCLILFGTSAGFSIEASLPTSAQTELPLQPWQRSVLQEAESFGAKLSGLRHVPFKISINEKSASYSGRADERFEDGSYVMVVTLDKGLFINRRLSPDGLRLLICHELGHFFGGAPRRSAPFEWDGPIAPDGFLNLSAEGQADTYASTTCFRALVTGQDHQAILKEEIISPRVRSLCASAHESSADDALICKRTAVGALNMLQLAMDFPISLEEADRTVAVSMIRDSYPDRQCRLDTFVAGALCKQSLPLIYDFSDPAKNECADAPAQRPRCWYR